MDILSLLQAGIVRSIGGVVLAVGILLVMITVHEFGHYIVGRILGFKIIYKFSKKFSKEKESY